MIEAFTVNDITLAPNESNISSRGQVEVHQYIYSAPMDSVTSYKLTEELVKAGGFPVVTRFAGPAHFITVEELQSIIRDFGTHPQVWFAFGLPTSGHDPMQEFKRILGDGFKKMNLALDIAHGDMQAGHSYTSGIQHERGFKGLDTMRFGPDEGKMMSGSICTGKSALNAIEFGRCTHLRVGVGPGSACTTRLMTGVGVPNAYAVHEIYEKTANEGYVPQIIADGGIKYPGDACKYLALGADGVMMGSAFAQCIEAPGWVMHEDDMGVVSGNKRYRGQASGEFQQSRFGKPTACPEGASGYIDYQGHTVQGVVDLYNAGARSCASYLGVSSTKSIDPGSARVLRVTASAQQEAQPHGFTSNYKV